MRLKDIFAETNRGTMLDLVVFIFNLSLMGLLTEYFTELIRLAGENDASAQVVILVCSAAMFFLPATGAVLKRWHFHQRRKASTDTEPESKRKQKRAFNFLDSGSKVVSGCSHTGCLMSSLFYFVLSIFLSAVVMSLVQTLLFGRGKENAAFFVTFVIITFVFCLVQTMLVYRYFLPPKKAPKGSFWRDPKSEQIGDLCIFLNMILFQIFWNIVIGQFPWSSVTSVAAFAGNLFILSFVALMIYFPPRIFFLAEDFNRPLTWLTMFLANSPTIVRVLFGRNQGLGW